MGLAASDPRRLLLERVQRSAHRSAAAGLHKLAFVAMCTGCQVQFRAPKAALAREFQDEVLRWMAECEARYSRFIPDSLVSRINAAAGAQWVEVDSETETLLDLCQEMSVLTHGVFEPTALPLLRLWNWKANPPVVPDDAAVRAAQDLVGWGKIQRQPGAVFLPRAGMGLDLGGIGKEYAVDRMLTLALQRGFNDVLVDFGQDVRVHGQPPGQNAWQIGLEDPKHPGRCWTGVRVTDQAVATSGDYVRYFTHQGRRYGHILDPCTGTPVNNGTLAVSVIAPQCALAGVFSKAAFVLGPKAGVDLMTHCPGVEGCITMDDSRHQTPQFSAFTKSC